MASVEFVDDGIKTIIQCNENDKLEDIIQRYCFKTEKNIEKMIFLYSGNIITNKNKTFNEIANSEDKKRKIMSIIIDNKSSDNKNLKKSKYIICPKCNDLTKINIKDYRISLSGCQKNHIIDNISLSDFNKLQLIDESKIICDICKNVNKANAYDNIFYICNKCNKYICPLCNSNHEKKHNRIEYELKYFKCKLHNESYIKYCNQCKNNICILCEKEHKNHNLISLVDILPNEDKLEENKNNLRNIINKFKNNIQDIINKLNEINNNIEIYYNIYNNIIEEYEIQKRNYYILENINNLDKYNNNLINDLNNINNDNNIYSKFDKIMNIYYKIYNNKELNNNNLEEKIKLEYENKINEIKNEYNIYIEKLKNENKNNIIKKEYNFGRYEGEMKNDKREGKGITYYKDGDKYDGEWKNNKKEGRGILYFSGGNRYEGEWKDDLFDGKGILYYENGDREMGDFLNGFQKGKHVILTSNGEVKTHIYD